MRCHHEKAPEALRAPQTQQPEKVTIAETLSESVAGSDAVAAAVAVTVTASRNRNRLGSGSRTRKTEADAKTDVEVVLCNLSRPGLRKNPDHIDRLARLCDVARPWGL